MQPVNGLDGLWTAKMKKTGLSRVIVWHCCNFCLIPLDREGSLMSLGWSLAAAQARSVLRSDNSRQPKRATHRTPSVQCVTTYVKGMKQKRNETTQQWFGGLFYRLPGEPASQRVR